MNISTAAIERGLTALLGERATVLVLVFVTRLGVCVEVGLDDAPHEVGDASLELLLVASIEAHDLVNHAKHTPEISGPVGVFVVLQRPDIDTRVLGYFIFHLIHSPCKRLSSK